MKISLSRLVACVKKHEQVKEGICSSEARGQFAGIMNRQIYHKWFTVAQIISSKHFYTCFFITTACHHLCWVVFEVFIIIIKQIVFFWYDCYRRWQGKETQLRSQSFILGDTLQLLTPLPRTGMFSKIWRAILVEVAGPKAPHWMPLSNQHFPRTSLTVIAPPSIHFVIQLVEYTFKPLL